MNPNRLPGRQPVTGGGMGGPAVPAPTPPLVPVPAPAPGPAPAPTPAPAQPTPFTGLDPLTRSLIEAAPLVPPEPVSTPTEPPTQILAPSARRTLKQPAILVALGGTLAAGLLFLSGAVKPRFLGHPRMAGQSPSVATTSAPAPILPAALPAASSWLMAGGRA